MLRPLIRQELLIHLMSARFFAAVVITLLLVVANTFVLIGAYEERLADYSQISFLPDWSACFYNNPSCRHISDALHVPLGDFGARLSDTQDG